MIMNCVKHVQACYWKGEAGVQASIIIRTLPGVLASRGSINSGFINILFTQSPKSALSGTLPDPKMQKQAQTTGPFKLLNHKI